MRASEKILLNSIDAVGLQLLAFKYLFVFVIVVPVSVMINLLIRMTLDGFAYNLWRYIIVGFCVIVFVLCFFYVHLVTQEFLRTTRIHDI